MEINLIFTVFIFALIVFFLRRFSHREGLSSNLEKLRNDFERSEKEIIAIHTKIINLHPNDPEGYKNRAEVRLHIEDYSGAITDYNEILKLTPNDAETYYNRGLAKYKLNNYQGSIDDYTMAILIQPNYSIAYVNRGNSKAMLNDFLGGIADFNEAIKIKADDALAYYNKGIAYLALHRKKDARANLQKAIDLGKIVSEDLIKMCD